MFIVTLQVDHNKEIIENFEFFCALCLSKLVILPFILLMTFMKD